MDATQRSLWELSASTFSLPVITGRLDALGAHEHVKRAVEVALAGDHTLTLVSIGVADDTAYLAEWTRSYGGTVAVVEPCPCGFFGDDERACVCRSRDVSGWKQRPAWRSAMTADVVVDVVRPSPDRIVSRRPGECDERVLERIEATRKQLASIPTDVSLDAAGQSLLKAAVRQLSLSIYRVNRMLAVARTIAALSLADRVGAAHLAEAVQYRPRF